jgi:tyrosine-protein phosphatase YwqE
VLEVKDESISADDIKNEIMKMNVHIDVEFLATITISDIAKISGKDYEYSAQVMCDTNKAYFINPDQNTITINLFGIEDNHIAFYKINDDGTKT